MKKNTHKSVVPTIWHVSLGRYGMPYSAVEKACLTRVVPYWVDPQWSSPGRSGILPQKANLRSLYTDPYRSTPRWVGKACLIES